MGVVLLHSAYLLDVVGEMQKELLDAISYMKEKKRIPTRHDMRALRKKSIELSGAAKELRACTMQVEGLRKHSRYQPGDNSNDA